MWCSYTHKCSIFRNASFLIVQNAFYQDSPNFRIKLALSSLIDRFFSSVFTPDFGISTLPSWLLNSSIPVVTSAYVKDNERYIIQIFLNMSMSKA